jgi:hypothetical protein
MIGTIRKHSGWLWAVIITATIISFIYWGAGQNRNGNGGGRSNLGMVYGKKISRDMYMRAQKDFHLFFFFRTGTWPDNSTQITKEQMTTGIYERILFIEKAEQLGVHVSGDAVAKAASERLQALGRGQVITLDALVSQLLSKEGMNEVDFENYIRDDLMIEELERVTGLSGDLVTPQEAAAAYTLDNEELSAQAVFFPATNYLGQVKTTAATVAQYYTNYQAAYRLPDRVQVNYVVFSASNYLARARAEWAQTNMNFKEVVESNLRKLGSDYKGARTPEEARTNIIEELVAKKALADANNDANEFATAVFKVEPAKAENLTTVANEKAFKDQGLIVHQTGLFDQKTGPVELDVSADFTKTAFALSEESPISEPLVDGDAIYILALARTVPSLIPPLEQIRARVTEDYQLHEATALAQAAGGAFYRTLTNQLAAGKSFDTACVLGGYKPETLPAFSTSTPSLPGLEDEASLGQIKQAAFTTGVGKTSGFEPTTTGGFILRVQAKLPLDQAKLAADLPEFTQNLRRARREEAFNEWWQNEAAQYLQMPKQQ